MQRFGSDGSGHDALPNLATQRTGHELLHGLCRFRRIVHFGREESNRWLCRFSKTCPVLPRSHLGVESLVLGACPFRMGISCPCVGSCNSHHSFSCLVQHFHCADVLPNLRTPGRCPSGGRSGGLAHFVAVRSHDFHTHRLLTVEASEDTIVALIILAVYGRSLANYP